LPQATQPLPQATQPLPQATQPLPQATHQTGGGKVSIQTASGPVLVVPMNVTHAAQRIASPAPGAPATYAIETSPSAMKSIGLESGNSRRSASSRSTSPSAPRVSNPIPFKGGAQSNTNPNVKVNVVKEG